jgi:hypothetical protein
MKPSSSLSLYKETSELKQTKHNETEHKAHTTMPNFSGNNINIHGNNSIFIK